MDYLLHTDYSDYITDRRLGEPGGQEPACHAQTKRDQSGTCGELTFVALGWLSSILLWFCFVGVMPTCISYPEATLCSKYFYSNVSTTSTYGAQTTTRQVGGVFTPLVGGAGLFYLLIMWRSPQRRALGNQHDISAAEYMVSLIRKAPVVSFSIECYHYETREVYNYSTKSYTTKREKVVTHTATEYLKYKSFRDESDQDPPLPTGVEAIRLYFSRSIYFAADGSNERYEEQFQDFVRRHDRDTYKDTSREFSIPGFKEYSLAFADPEHPPFYFSRLLFWVAALSSVGMPYLNNISTFSAILRWTVFKEITV
jgi:hypothetical protein